MRNDIFHIYENYKRAEGVIIKIDNMDFKEH